MKTLYSKDNNLPQRLGTLEKNVIDCIEDMTESFNIISHYAQAGAESVIKSKILESLFLSRSVGASIHRNETNTSVQVYNDIVNYQNPSATATPAASASGGNSSGNVSIQRHNAMLYANIFFSTLD